MIKKLFILIICYLLICLYGKSQQSILSVQRFEYIWQPDLRTPLETRVIFASDDSIKQTIEKSFVYALQKRWNVTMPLNSLTVKRLSLFYLGEKPKFNTKMRISSNGAPTRPHRTSGASASAASRSDSRPVHEVSATRAM